MQPLVSVNMCVYNVAPYLKETIDSILNQTYRNIEYIFVDDGSTDGSLEILEAYAAKDNRILVLKNGKNLGISPSRNHCLQHSTGKYIAIQDADDISLPHRIETQVNLLEKEGNESVGYCGAWLEHFGSETAVSKYKNKYLKEMQLSNCMFGHPSTFFRKKILDDHHISFKTEFDPANDYELQTALIPHTEFFNIQEVLVRYRQHSTNLSNNKERMFGKAKSIREAQFERFLKTTLTDNDKKNINNFFVIYQYAERAPESEVLFLMSWMKDMISKGAQCDFYSEKGLKATFTHFYFKLWARQEKITAKSLSRFITSGLVPALFLTYSLRDILFLLKKR